ncbi:hypothetical protein DLAC_01643 [Tieghemostelium lacteum]|uniref:CAF1B/HIR1 beta-propeller domain-containing protein n=1 Tax=Tieghemostelium lacteum TaxID=361077 RepID=A0A152A5Z1_TIELA|nr:hypothetical protein DLAC_01643 [Tieghemostelium lacteum]|eukprot:KYR01640.1 hypothetical protein DLAC_01643 [Tieghemostelium lacteum]
MKCETVMILWHNQDPIYSIDFENGTNKFCTAGFDNEIKIWSYTKNKETSKLSIEYLSSLKKHSKPVNIARFSPCGNLLASGSDDGNIIIWKLNTSTTSTTNIISTTTTTISTSATPTKPAQNRSRPNPLVASDDNYIMKEQWSMVNSLMVPKDVYDLAWSSDGQYLSSASTDNTVIVWSPLSKSYDQVIIDHSHYVQGVSWDPLGDYLLTQSSDATCRLYTTNKARKEKKLIKEKVTTTTAAATKIR